MLAVYSSFHTVLGLPFFTKNCGYTHLWRVVAYPLECLRVFSGMSSRIFWNVIVFTLDCCRVHSSVIAFTLEFHRVHSGVSSHIFWNVIACTLDSHRVYSGVSSHNCGISLRIPVLLNKTLPDHMPSVSNAMLITVTVVKSSKLKLLLSCHFFGSL
jgi:hypothetical protein